MLLTKQMKQDMLEYILSLQLDMGSPWKSARLWSEERVKLLFWGRRMSKTLAIQEVTHPEDFRVKQTKEYLESIGEKSLGVVTIPQTHLESMREIIGVRKRGVTLFHPIIQKEIERGKGFVKERDEIYFWNATYSRQKL